MPCLQQRTRAGDQCDASDQPPYRRTGRDAETGHYPSEPGAQCALRDLDGHQVDAPLRQQDDRQRDPVQMMVGIAEIERRGDCKAQRELRRILPAGELMQRCPPARQFLRCCRPRLRILYGRRPGIPGHVRGNS